MCELRGGIGGLEVGRQRGSAAALLAPVEGDVMVEALAWFVISAALAILGLMLREMSR